MTRHTGCYPRVPRGIGILALIASAVLVASCSAQRTLVAGGRYAEAYSKVGDIVDETLILAKNAGRRTSLAEQYPVAPSSDAKQRAIALACPERNGPAAKAAYAGANLSKYQSAVAALAKAPEDSVAGVVAGLRKELPTADDVVKSFEDFAKAEQLRRESCRAFAELALKSSEVKGWAAGDKVRAVFGILKDLLSAIEAQRRAVAYKNLVIALDEPVRDNLTALEGEMRRLLLQIARESLLSVASDLDAAKVKELRESRAAAANQPSTAASANPDPTPMLESRWQTLESAMRALQRFDRAYAIFDGLYAPVEDGAGVFPTLRAAHTKVVDRARSGKVDSGEAIDDLLAVLGLVNAIGEKLDKL